MARALAQSDGPQYAKNYLCDLYCDEQNCQLIEIDWSSSPKDGWAGRDETPKKQMCWAVRSDMLNHTIDVWLLDELVILPSAHRDPTTIDFCNQHLWNGKQTDDVYRTIDCSYDGGKKRLTFEYVEPEEHHLSRLATLQQRVFRRLRGDRRLHYGDGGNSLLIYPVYVARKLGLTRERRRAFVAALTCLSELKNDFQEQRPWIKDIVDPDLCPYLLPDWQTHRLAEIVDTLKQRAMSNGFQRDLVKEKRNLETGRYPEYVQLRKSYRWIPSKFLIQKGNVNIASKINNLDVTKANEPIYRGLASAFKKMLPAFRKLGLLKQDSDAQELMVVVKCQQYILEPHTSYSGRWHREGMDERVAAVGVYYCHVDTELTGGSLKFRPDEPPTASFAPGLQYDLEVPVESDSAVVFSNVMPHRFRALRNPTSQRQRRLFVNLFVLQPTEECALTISATRGEIVVLLRRVCAGIARDICAVIFRHMEPFRNWWPSLPEARAFRAKVKAGLMETRRGWGYIHWGNCGTIKYLADAKHHDFDTRDTRHTDSGADEFCE